MKTSYPYIQIGDTEHLPSPQEGTDIVGRYAFQYIDFRGAEDYVQRVRFVDCCFFGCEMLPQMDSRMEGCIVLPKMGMRFKAFNTELYNADTLYDGFVPGNRDSFKSCYDSTIYKEFMALDPLSGDIRTTMAITLHDHSMLDCMAQFISRFGFENVIGIMGGHGISRADEGYRKIVFLSKALAERGKIMLSGGGPGAMEATHFGAWMAGRGAEDVEEALSMLTEADEKDSYSWLNSAVEVIHRFPQERYVSIAIPTWIYGHEPSTPFATHIAKFFQNSIREDIILACALGGIIFTPGSAGTMQEIFQNASMLHYDSSGIVGPMIFLGSEFFTKEIPVYPFLKDLVDRGKYCNLRLSLTDDIGEVMKILL